ncbi:hypothetical protein Pcinc_044309 [Petrolisthes cinctipes]|uniref:Uncharacterized protein n=1 Tax=Petrolisthes cinctipes TaxID=88211 RepID=A0AAE1BF50_PETCI|nr:hypothetical protein Pcinc_044309 [Petrolisthes cinctipes]
MCVTPSLTIHFLTTDCHCHCPSLLSAIAPSLLSATTTVPSLLFITAIVPSLLSATAIVPSLLSATANATVPHYCLPLPLCLTPVCVPSRRLPAWPPMHLSSPIYPSL